MLSKQRIHHTTNFQEPDKVPAHMNASRWVVGKLKKALQVNSDKELLKALNIDVYDMRGIDLHSGTVPVYVGPQNAFFNSGWRGGIGSFWGIIEKETNTSSGWTLDMGEPPLAGEISMDDLEKYPWPQNDWFDYSNLRNELDYWKEFSVMATGASVFACHFYQGDGLSYDGYVNQS